MKKMLAYVGLAVGVALLTTAAMFTYNAMTNGQPMSGIVVRQNEAALEVSDQPGADQTLKLKVNRVVAPGPSWIVVSQVTMGAVRGMMSEPDPKAAPAPEPLVIAVVPIQAGESRDIVIPLGTLPLTRMLSVVLHADRGTVGTFEWNMNRFAESPDKPYYRMAPGGAYSALQLGRQVLVQ